MEIRRAIDQWEDYWRGIHCPSRHFLALWMESAKECGRIEGTVSVFHQ